MDRDKVIKGLECVIDENHFDFKHCHSCEYRKDIDHLQYVCDADRCIADAIAMLKAQKARVMTENDMREAEPGTVIFCEQRNEVRTYLTPMIKYDDGAFENRFLGAEPEAAQLANTRFWTSRPTAAERKAVKWE